MHQYKHVEINASGDYQVVEIRSDGRKRKVDQDHPGYLAWIAAGNTPVIDTYVPRPEPTVDQIKAKKIISVDGRTVSLIAEGFEYDGQKFSMSMAAQKNWLGLAIAWVAGLIQYPYEISTADEDGYELLDAAHTQGFLLAYMDYQANPEKPLGQGRVLKKAIKNAETVLELADIEDTRGFIEPPEMF